MFYKEVLGFSHQHPVVRPSPRCYPATASTQARALHSSGVYPTVDILDQLSGAASSRTLFISTSNLCSSMNKTISPDAAGPSTTL